MAHYAIGDVQGCRAALENLLDTIAFDPAQDRLYFAGDLVARGPDSLGTLRLIHALGFAADTVLGNHDLHLIAAHHGLATLKVKDGTQPILDAPDRTTLMAWLQARPLLIELPDVAAQPHVLCHAGWLPGWTPAQARDRAREVEAALRSPEALTYLANMYGNEPAVWCDDLAGMTRLRAITNVFTRMRLLHADGSLDFLHKDSPNTAPPGLKPWYAANLSAIGETRIVFGHWAAILGITHQPQCIALDTGCVWGNHLTAYRLEDGRRFYSRPGLQ